MARLTNRRVPTLRTQLGKTEGNACLTDELTLHGMVIGDITVLENGVLHLHGTCTGSLIVERGGRAEVYGVVVNDVINRGGDIEVRGMIHGLVREGAGRTLVCPGAVISGLTQ